MKCLLNGFSRTANGTRREASLPSDRAAVRHGLQLKSCQEAPLMLFVPFLYCSECVVWFWWSPTSLWKPRVLRQRIPTCSFTPLCLLGLNIGMRRCSRWRSMKIHWISLSYSWRHMNFLGSFFFPLPALLFKCVCLLCLFMLSKLCKTLHSFVPEKKWLRFLL